MIPSASFFFLKITLAIQGLLWVHIIFWIICCNSVKKSHSYFDTDCIALFEEKWKVSNKSVIVSCSKFDLISDDNVTLFPLLNANKRSKAYWAKCYQAVKHDRANSLVQYGRLIIREKIIRNLV